MTMTATDMPSVSVIYERGYPLFIGLASGAAIVAASPWFFCYASGHGWKFDTLYEASFEFAAVATSFLFTFYTFVVTAERGFIARMKNSIYYAQLIKFTVSALVLGTALALVSIPMMVIDPSPLSRWDLPTLSIAGWAFVTGWSLAAFVRTARLFIAFAAAD